MKKFLAFTLAETLIVIGVIGIVSALTLPNLNSSTGDKERVAKVKKIYQNLQDAFGRAEAVYGPYSDWFVSDGDDIEAKAKRVGERISEFMKVQKVCSTRTTGCFKSGKARKINGEEINSNDFDASTNDYKFVTADGSSIAMRVRNNETSIYVDIDGPSKGYYTEGKDIFEFKIDDVGLFTNGYSNSISELITNSKNTGTSMATWIINYDNADYLKLNSNGKCPNGTTPTAENPRCK